MIDVFISRPNWVAPEFEEGLTSFLSFLGTHDIKPRTLGSTDQPTEAPLDEVIAIMSECKGAIILGYPQIYVKNGYIKATENNNFQLPTEWNHIEATLAYFKKMPLLVIHHNGISRGIFERGAISKFLYSKDLSKPTWFLSEDLIGALMKWKSSLKEPQTKQANIPKPLTQSSIRPTDQVLVKSAEKILSNETAGRRQLLLPVNDNYICRFPSFLFWSFLLSGLRCWAAAVR